jgi:hypothetical protein
MNCPLSSLQFPLPDAGCFGKVMAYPLMTALGYLVRVEIGGPAASGTMTADEASKDKSNNMHIS